MRPMDSLLKSITTIPIVISFINVNDNSIDDKCNQVSVMPKIGKPRSCIIYRDDNPLKATIYLKNLSSGNIIEFKLPKDVHKNKCVPTGRYYIYSDNPEYKFNDTVDVSFDFPLMPIRRENIK